MNFEKMLRIVFLVGIFQLLCFSCYATLTISSIKFEGLKRVKQESIDKLLNMKVGAVVDAFSICEDIKALYKTGEFSSVETYITKHNGSVTLIYNVIEQPIIKHLHFRGQQAISLSKLKATVSLKKDGPFSNARLHTDLEKLKQLYKERGYYFVSVKGDYGYTEDGVDVVIHINEGDKVEVRRVDFDGNMAYSDHFLLAKMDIKGRPYLDEVLEKDIQNLTKLYHNSGYPFAIISKKQVEYDAKLKGLVVSLDIDEGDRFVVGKVLFEGNNAFDTERLTSLVQIEEGNYINLEAINQAAQDIQQFYYNNGYVSAQVQPYLHYDFKKSTVKVIFHIREAQTAYIKRIEICGNTYTKPNVIKRELLLKEGDLLNAELLRISIQNLVNLGYFEDVKWYLLSDEKDSNYKVLRIEVKEGQTNLINFSSGWRTNPEGLFGGLEWRSLNLFGRGYSLNTKVEFGKRLLNYEFSFFNPRFRNSHTSVGINLWRTKATQYTQGYSEANRGGSLSLGRRFAKFNSYNFEYKYNRSKIFDVKKDVAEDIKEWVNIVGEGKWFNRSVISFNIKRNTIDNIFNPHRGYMISFSSELASPQIASDVEYFKPQIKANYYFPTVLGCSFGLLFNSASLIKFEKQLPAVEKFYLGGAETIRGYPTNYIHPKGGGGRAYWLTTALFKIPLGKNFSCVLFLDSGNSGISAVPDFRHAWTGVGIGLHSHISIFPLRIDLGWALTGTPTWEQPKWHVSFGSPLY